MTSSRMVSVKVPERIFRALPPAHEGRSQFILDAMEEKIARETSQWVPTTERGKKMAKLLRKGAEERGVPMTAEEIAKELEERRGKFH